MKCENCGIENAENMNFCSSCGNKLNEADAPANNAESTADKTVNEVGKSEEKEVAEKIVEKVELVEVKQDEVKSVENEKEAEVKELSPAKEVEAKASDKTVKEVVNENKVKPSLPLVEDKRYKPMGFFGWLWSLIVLSIPLLSFIFILVWSFSSGTNKSKQSFARVLLFFNIIGIVLVILAWLGVLAVGSFIDSSMIERGLEFMIDVLE